MAKDFPGRGVKRKELEQLLASGGWTRAGDLRGIATTHRAEGDDRVLVVYFDGTAVLADSQAALEAYLAGLDAMPLETHVLDGYPGFDEGFLGRLDAYVAALPGLLGISSKLLDGSVDSLAYVDTALASMTLAKRRRLLANIVAYVGEVLRHASGGEWQLTRAGSVSEPAIVERRLGTVALAVLVLDALPLAKEGSALHGIVQAQLSLLGVA